MRGGHALGPGSIPGPDLRSERKTSFLTGVPFCQVMVHVCFAQILSANMHAYQNQSEWIQCPRCNDEMSKSDLNSHMGAKHEVENFDQMLKRSFKPFTSTKVALTI